MSDLRENLFRLPTLNLDSKVADLIIQLEPLRTKHLEAEATTPPWVFFGVKNLYQTIESVTSARIEGNNTTIADFVEAAREDGKAANADEKIRMILNVENGISFIESQELSELNIDKEFIHQLHRIVTDGLDVKGEGDSRPGAYRDTPRQISHSSHVLPAPADIRDLMDGLVNFINGPLPHQMDLIRIAQAHHRFVWIHPYGNGNGRVVRLLTYAMLAKCGYIDKDGARLLDPAAVFGSNKFIYYDMLAVADDVSEHGLVQWCEYMLNGLAAQVKKIDQLLDGDFTKKQIIIPAIEYAYGKERISKLERDMLIVCVEEDVISASDLKHLFPEGISHVNISQAIKRLREQNLIEPISEGARKYTLCMNRSPLTIGILKKLDENGFLPPIEPRPTPQPS
ncbi:MAG: Fic family protein [Candidatus Saccharimonadales bacterium]